MDLLWDWYGMIPNKVLYDNSLKDKEKLVYIVVSSLCAEKWYCRASNSYMWNLLWVTPRTIINAIQVLVDKWYLKSDIDKSKGNERHLSLWIPTEKIFTTYWKNFHNPTEKNFTQLIQYNNIIYIASYEDIKETIDNYEYRLNNNKLLKCLIKLVELWYKVEKNEKEIKKFVDWLKEKAEIYNYKLPDWNIAQWELLQVFDTWYEYHKWKWDVSNYLSSVLTFMRNYKQPHFKNKK